MRWIGNVFRIDFYLCWCVLVRGKGRRNWWLLVPYRLNLRDFSVVMTIFPKLGGVGTSCTSRPAFDVHPWATLQESQHHLSFGQDCTVSAAKWNAGCQRTSPFFHNKLFSSSTSLILLKKEHFRVSSFVIINDTLLSSSESTKRSLWKSWLYVKTFCWYFALEVLE